MAGRAMIEAGGRTPRGFPPLRGRGGRPLRRRCSTRLRTCTTGRARRSVFEEEGSELPEALCKKSVDAFRKTILSEESITYDNGTEGSLRKRRTQQIEAMEGKRVIQYGRRASLMTLNKFFKHRGYEKLSRPMSLGKELADITYVAVHQLYRIGEFKNIDCEMPLSGGPISVITSKQ